MDSNFISLDNQGVRSEIPFDLMPDNYWIVPLVGKGCIRNEEYEK